MPKTRFTEGQISYALKQAENGTPAKEVCRTMGISEAVFYLWKKKHGGMRAGELRRLKQLESENRKLNRWWRT